MDATTRRKAVLSIGSVLLVGGCSDAIGSNDEDEGDGNEADDADGASGDDPDATESDSDEDGSDTEDVGDDEDASDADDEDGATDDDPMSADEFVAQVADVYDGEVAAYEEDETHGELVLIGDADVSRLELAGVVQNVLEVYSAYVDRGDAPTEQLAGTVETDDGQAIGSVTVRTEWVEAYNRGEIAEGELRDRVLGTVET